MGLLVSDLCGSGVHLVETHTAWVFIGEDTVFKVKKPVNLGFLDFTSKEQRLAACEAEVRLNARLAPHVYRRVVPIRQDAHGHHRVGGEGELVDHAVEMARLPDSVRADLLLEMGRLGSEVIEGLGTLLARFHAGMPTSADIARSGAPEAILANVAQNFAQGGDACRACLSVPEAAELEAAQLTFVETRRALFEERMRDGRVRDGHGDLRLEHVYLVPGEAPAIIDCLEFSDRLRCGDVAADLAFLSMDLRRLGRPALAERLIAAYARESGDYSLYALVDFYEGYRAYVRGKVASFLMNDERAGREAREHAQGEARRSFRLALHAGRATARRPLVVAVGGVIASGKSTLAGHVGELLSAPIVDADRTRKALIAVEATTPLCDAAFSGAYTLEQSERTYAELRRRAACVLASGRPVVLDASFRSRSERGRARELARANDADFVFVECRVDAEESRRRLRERAKSAHVSDGREEIFDAFAASWEDVRELPEAEHLVVDTSLPSEDNLHRLKERLPALWRNGTNPAVSASMRTALTSLLVALVALGLPACGGGGTPSRSPSLDYPAAEGRTSDGQVVGADGVAPGDKLATGVQAGPEGVATARPPSPEASPAPGRKPPP